MLTSEDIEFRRNKIGASDAGSILGVNPYKSASKLWEEKVFGKEEVTTWRMEHGNENEPKALLEFEKLTGLFMVPGKRMINKDLEWQIATLDGITIDGDIIVEIKCTTTPRLYDMAMFEEIPPYYYAQIQHQICVCNPIQAYYCVYFDQKACFFEVKRDEAYIHTLIEKETEFLGFMQSMTPPPRKTRAKESKHTERSKTHKR